MKRSPKFSLSFFIVLLLICITFFCKAQYKPLLNSEHRWYINFPGLGYEFWDDHYIIDTIIINGVSYSQSKQPSNNFGIKIHPLREDTATKKVFSINLTDSTENILYDFSLNLNDTFYQSSDTFIVTAVDSAMDSISIPICGELDTSFHKFITLTHISASTNNKYYWIEGIGSLNGLMPWYQTAANLSCFYNTEDNNAFRSYCYNLYYQDPCFTGYWASSVSSISEIEIPSFPNPTNEKFQVFLENFEDDVVSIQMMDQSGRFYTISPSQTTNHLIVNVSDLSTGIYLLTLTDNSGNIYVEKIVKY